MTGFEPRTSDIGSDRSTNWATQPLPVEIFFVGMRSKLMQILLFVQLPPDVGVQLLVQRFESLPGCLHFINKSVHFVFGRKPFGSILVSAQPKESKISLEQDELKKSEE